MDNGRYFIIIALILVFSSLMISYPLINSVKAQAFTFNVVDEEGRPLENVYVQGVIPLPPDKGSIWETL